MAAYIENDRAELDRFKQDINLTEYAAHLGYALDRRESSRHSITMCRSSDHDKVIVARNTNGHWIYFSVRDSGDNGSVIDFHQRRTHNNLGETRKALRDFMGLEPARRPDAPSYAPTLEPTPLRDQVALDAELLKAKPGVSQNRYLSIERAIGKEVLLNNQRFETVVRSNEQGRVFFPHYDERGVYSGSEIKGRGFTGFSPGGEKGLWQSHTMTGDKFLVICESAIDCLSHYALFYQEHEDVRHHTRYISTAGAWGPKTPGLLRKEVESYAGQYVTLSFDNDQQGREYAEDATALLGNLGKVLRVRLPEGYKDWNEQLVSERAKTHNLA